MKHSNPLNRPSIVDAVKALFQHGRNSEQYKRAIQWVIQSGDVKFVTGASPDQVMEIRHALGIQPWESR